MRVELRVEARRGLVEGALFCEQQREGHGHYFTDCPFEDLGRLESEADMVNHRKSWRLPLRRVRMCLPLAICAIATSSERYLLKDKQYASGVNL